MIARADCQTSTTSLPSITHVGTSKAHARSPIRPAVMSRDGVNSENVLFSQTKITGQPQTAAMLSVSISTPWLAAPSPKKHTATLPSPSSWAPSSGAGGDRQPGPHDAIGAEHPLGQVGDVHRPAHAAADALPPTPDLGEHGRHVAALGEVVPVTTMRRCDVVAVAELRAQPDHDRFLTDVQVERARRLPSRVPGGQSFLTAADQQHLLVEPEQFVGVRCHRYSLGRVAIVEPDRWHRGHAESSARALLLLFIGRPMNVHKCRRPRASVALKRARGQSLGPMRGGSHRSSASSAATAPRPRFVQCVHRRRGDRDEQPHRRRQTPSNRRRRIGLDDPRLRYRLDRLVFRGERQQQRRHRVERRGRASRRDACLSPSNDPLHEARMYAIAHIAVHDAVNADRPSVRTLCLRHAHAGRDIGRRRDRGGCPLGIGRRTAGSTVGAVPAVVRRSGNRDRRRRLHGRTGGDPNGTAKSQGVAVGEASAAAIVALRSDDHANDRAARRHRVSPGDGAG